MDLNQVEVQAQAKYLASQRESAGNDAAVMAGRLAVCNTVSRAKDVKIKQLEDANKMLSDHIQSLEQPKNVNDVVVEEAPAVEA